MPSINTTPRTKKKWKARVKRDGIDYHLGYFQDYYEALKAEQKFSLTYPPRQVHKKKLRSEQGS